MAHLIHPTAIIDPSAILADDVSIGPYSIIGARVQIGAKSSIGPHVIIEEDTRMGERCQLAPGAVIGGLPQDHGFGGERSGVWIGNDVVIRECVTINRATGEGNTTQVGNECMIMAYSHLAHNCVLGERVVLANNVQLAGYVELGDDAFIGGTCVVHQFVKIGRLTIMGGFTGTRQDLPPFAMTEGRPATVRGINSIGLKRRGFGMQERSRLKRAFYHLFFSHQNIADACDALRQEFSDQPDPNIEELLSFVQSAKRGIRKPGRQVETDEPVTLSGVN